MGSRTLQFPLLTMFLPVLIVKGSIPLSTQLTSLINKSHSNDKDLELQLHSLPKGSVSSMGSLSKTFSREQGTTIFSLPSSSNLHSQLSTSSNSSNSQGSLDSQSRVRQHKLALQQ